MQLRGKRIAILAEDLYEDLELWYPALRFREVGAEVTFVGSGKDTYTSRHGYPVRADTRAEDVRVTDFDAVIIPGGYARDNMRRHPAMVAVVREAYEQTKGEAPICPEAWSLRPAVVRRGMRRPSCARRT